MSRADMSSPDTCATSAKASSSEGRPSRISHYLGVYFQCCRVLSRIHPNRRGSAYCGACPRCARRIQIAIDPDASADSRFIVAG